MHIYPRPMSLPHSAMVSKIIRAPTSEIFLSIFDKTIHQTLSFLSPILFWYVRIDLTGREIPVRVFCQPFPELLTVPESSPEDKQP